MSSLDLEGFPHILQSISSYSDRSTLATLLRVSTLASGFALPLLYPKTHIIDPFPPIKRAHTTSHPILPLEWSDLLPKKTTKAKITLFLSSPHLARVKQIVIRRPDIMAGRVARLGKAPQPAERGKGTITTIWVEPWRLKWGHLTKGVGGRSVVVKDPKCQNGELSRPETKSSERPLPHFLHILDVANLIPSEHLILYVPPSADVNFQALCEVAHKYQRPRGVQHLTLIFGDAFARMTRYQGINSSIHSDHGLSSSTPPWTKCTIILLPRTSTSTRTPSNRTVAFGPLLPSYHNGCKPPANFTYIGDYDITGGRTGIVKDGEKLDGFIWRIKGIDEWWEEEQEVFSCWLDRYWDEGCGGQGSEG